MITVDTSVWVDLFNEADTAQTAWLQRYLGFQKVMVLDLVLCEVLQGFNHPREFAQVQTELLRFPVVPSVGQHVALAAAKNFQLLRRRGVTVRKTVDCLIATGCILGGHELLHNDRDFDPFERHLGLKVIHP